MWYLKLISFYSPTIAPAVAAAGISAVGSLLGGVIGGSGADNKDARRMMSYQNFLNEQAIKNSYPLTMQSMRDAGLNPMLAFQQGANPHSVSPQQPINNKRQLGEAVSNASQIAATVANTTANTAKQQAETEKAQADTALSTAQAIETAERTKTYPVTIQNVLSQSALSSVQYNKALAEIKQLEKQGNLTEAATKEALARAGLTTAQIREVQPRINNLTANTAHTNASIGKAEILGLPGNMLRELLKNSASDSNSAGGKIIDSIKSNASQLNSPNYRRYSK